MRKICTELRKIHEIPVMEIFKSNFKPEDWKRKFEKDIIKKIDSLESKGLNFVGLYERIKDAFDDMRMGFLSGTDDYMVKPINVNEMVLRVGALLRRAQMINERRQVIGNTVLECDSLTVSTDEESVILPQKEFMLLYKMASYPGRIFTRQQLMDETG